MTVYPLLTSPSFDLGTFVVATVGNFLFSMQRTPSVVSEPDLCVDVLYG